MKEEYNELKEKLEEIARSIEIAEEELLNASIIASKLEIKEERSDKENKSVYHAFTNLSDELIDAYRDTSRVEEIYKDTVYIVKKEKNNETNK